ncbi:MAG: ABC transporter substrate-binding protein [Chloroflexota bacterium]
MKRTLSITGATIALAAAIAGPGIAPTAAADASPAAPSATTGRGPVTVDQCTGETRDRTTTYDTIPERIFTTDPQSAEFLIAMGLGDRIVATWGMYPEEILATLPEYADALRKIPVVGDDTTWPPTLEIIAAAKPDILVTTYRLNIPGYLDSTRLQQDMGIASYTFLANCTGGVMRTFDPLFEDVRNLGAIFDVPDAAEALVGGMQAQLDEAAALTAGKEPVPVWEYAGEQVPYPVGGTGIPNAVMTLAGAKNVFEDVPAVYGEVSWEQVIARNPAVIWLQTDAGPGFIQAQDGLTAAVESNAGLAAVDGVANKAYVVVPYTTGGTLSVHNAEAVLDFATKLQAVTPAP